MKKHIRIELKSVARPKKQGMSEEELIQEAYKIGKKEKEKGNSSAVMENKAYIDFATQNGTLVEISGNIDLDTEIMRAFHNGYDGRNIKDQCKIGEQIGSLLQEEEGSSQDQKVSI